ncbi:MAG: hypothetical protein UX81_C0043G0002 [Parcubacteria group bacterium GW2011_GWA2_47_12]|nr:MAG: hypothetical protein UX81_C0043G0002 [Parcubacteria group bacterium GW2011_GWA2_47_12]
MESKPIVVDNTTAGAAIASAPLSVHADILQDVGISQELSVRTQESSADIYTSVLQNTAIATEAHTENSEPGLSYADVLENISIANEAAKANAAVAAALAPEPAGNPVYSPIPIPIGPGGFRGGGGGGSSAAVAAAPDLGATNG